MVTVTYHFDDHFPIYAWATGSDNLDDGSILTFASTKTNLDLQWERRNTCDGTNLGTISKVEIRVFGKYSGLGIARIRLVPVFSGGNGGNHDDFLATIAAWSAWFDITIDPNAPSPSWTWSDVQDLDMKIYSMLGLGKLVCYAAKVEIKVTYTPGEDFFESLGDSLGVSDSIASVAAYKRTPGDTLSLGDVLVSAAGYKRSPGDSFSIGDALQHKKKLSLGDSFSVGDGLIKEVRIPIEELLSIADALKKTFKTSFSDTLSISDEISLIKLQLSLSDTLTISDLLELKLKISWGEQLSIADQVLVARVFYLTDTLSISDSLTHQFIVPGGLTDLTETPALIVTRCYAIADDVPKTEKLRVWARAKDGKEKVIYIDPA